ncbi:MAG: polysaccharide biosynthesis C-terminal domain-containing protein [Bacteroidetes bacterium]|nr:polysaccharide biosynthesis C-terminal domain-containing protein [Bacteroidota bacterium]
MINDLKDTVRQSAVYGLGSVATKAMSIFLFPLYSLRFTVEQYGVIVRAEILWQLLFTVIHFSVSIATFRWLRELTSDHDRNTLLNSLLVFHACVGIAIFMVSLPFYRHLTTLLLDVSPSSMLLLLIQGIAIGETLLFVPLMVLRHEAKPWQYGGLVMVNAGVSTILQVVVLSLENPTIEHLYIARVVGTGVALLVAAVPWRHRTPVRWDALLLRRIISFSTPIVFVSLLAFLLNGIDRYLLAFLGNAKEVGWYGLGANIAGLLVVVFITPFVLVFPPLAWKKKDETNAKRFFTKSLTYAFFAFCLGALGLSLATPLLIRVFALNPEYWHAEMTIPILSLALAFSGVTSVGTMSFYLKDRTDITLWLFGGLFAFHIGANVIAIPLAGMYGAAFVKLLTFVAHFILLYMFSRRGFYFPYEMRKIVLMTLLAVGLWGVTLILPPLSIALQLVVRCALFAAFPILLLPLGFYEPIERQRLREIAVRIRHTILMRRNG